jgi:DNA gyrase/topoisomerase IV subunit B
MGDRIAVISGLAAIRMRPEMYVGPPASASRANMLVREAMCHCLHSIAVGDASHARVVLRPHGALVEDDSHGFLGGRSGEDEDIAAALDELFTVLWACHRAKDDDQLADLLCGVGIVVVTALAARLQVRSTCVGKAWTGSYCGGDLTTPFVPAEPVANTFARLDFDIDTAFVPEPTDAEQLGAWLETLSPHLDVSRIEIVAA